MAETVSTLIELECSLDGKYWKWIRFTTILPYSGEEYAVVIQNLAISFFETRQKAKKFLHSFEVRVQKLSLVLALAGMSPRIVMVRIPVKEVEIVDSKPVD